MYEQAPGRLPEVEYNQASDRLKMIVSFRQPSYGPEFSQQLSDYVVSKSATAEALAGWLIDDLKLASADAGQINYDSCVNSGKLICQSILRDLGLYSMADVVRFLRACSSAMREQGKTIPEQLSQDIEIVASHFKK